MNNVRPSGGGANTPAVIRDMYATQAINGGDVQYGAGESRAIRPRKQVRATGRDMTRMAGQPVQGGTEFLRSAICHGGEISPNPKFVCIQINFALGNICCQHAL